MTVILTTHDMSDIKELAQRIIVIGNGSKLYDGSPNKIINQFNDIRKITIPINKNSLIVEALNNQLDDYQIVHQLENEITLEVKEGDQLQKLVELITQKFNVQNYSVQPLNTEEVIAHFYEQHRT